MSDTTFVAYSNATPITASWLNDVNNAIYGVGNQSRGSALLQFIQAGTGTTTRTVQAKERDIVSVKDFGVIGDGVTDNAVALMVADVAAATAGKALYFPDGVYLVGGIRSNVVSSYTVLRTARAWYGESQDVIIRQKDFNSASARFIVLAVGLTNVDTRNITFDGQCTTVAAGTTPNTEPAAAGSYSDTSNESLWAKSYGPRFFNCTNVSFRDCHSKNFLRAGFRVDGDGLAYATPAISSNIRFDGCTTSRTRGIYGDGFYLGGVTDAKFVNCHAYDYQRIGFVLEFAPTDGVTDCRDIAYANCTSDYGHDAVASESNAGFWSECGDNISHVNCTSKRTAIGYVTNAVSCADTGTTRSWTAPQSFVSCNSLKTQQHIRAVYSGTRSVRLTIDGGFGECNAASSGSDAYAPTYAYENLGLVGGVTLGFVDTTANVNIHANISHVTLLMVDRALALGVGTEFGAIRLIQGNVTTASQFTWNITGCAFQWSKTDGTDDVNAKTVLYRTSTRAHYGDIIIGGFQDSGSANDYRLRGYVRISNCQNHTFGYVMLASEMQAGVLTLSNTPVSLRATTSNVGDLIVSGCPTFDVRGQAGFTEAKIDASTTFIDADEANPDRTTWNPITLFDYSYKRRPLWLEFTGGDTSNRVFAGEIGGTFAMSVNNETSKTMLRLGVAVAGQFIVVKLKDPTFRNIASGTMAATASQIMLNITTASGSSIELVGSGGGLFDNGMVTGGGHVLVTETSGPTYNDAPQTVTAPIVTVLGVRQQFAPV